MNRFRCMESTSPGKIDIKALLLILLCSCVWLPAQDFNDPPPILYNQISDSGSLIQELDTTPENKSFEPKSVSSAFFLSLLLPGLGEAYVGETGYTKVFMSLEAVGWGMFIATDLQVASRKQDYENFAVQHAGVIRSGKDDQYWIDIGKYDNIWLFNEQRRRDRDIDAIYPETSTNYWRWDQYANRLKYDEYRIGASQIDERKTFIIGGIILNHLVSAINALRLARAHNRESDQLSWKFDSGIRPGFTGLSLGISKSF